MGLLLKIENCMFVFTLKKMQKRYEISKNKENIANFGLANLTG